MSLVVSDGASGCAALFGLGCTGEERAVYEEFPQYGGRTVEPGSNEQFGGCYADYETRAPGKVVRVSYAEDVQAYYAEKLRENDWRLTLEPSETRLARRMGEIPKGDSGRLIAARRSGYHYEVIYIVPDEPRPSLYVQAVVDER